MNSLLEGEGIRLHSPNTEKKTTAEDAHAPAQKSATVRRQSSLLGGKISTEDARVLLIQGAAGTGKSLFGWKLCQEWGHVSKRGDTEHPIALFLSLPMYKDLLSVNKARSRLLPEYFRKNFGLNDEQVERIREMPFVIVLDGLDELNDKFHLWTECELYHWTNTFFIVSSRTVFLQGDDINSYLVPRAPDSTKPLYRQLAQLFLLPFSSEQAEEYVKQFAKGPDNVSKWSSEKYQEERAKMPELKELGREPLILFMILRILPRLARNSKDAQRLDPNLLEVELASKIEVPFLHTRRVELYAIFFEDWMEREIKRQLAPLRLDESSDEYQDKFYSIKNNVTGFSKHLAIEMFFHNLTSVQVSLEKWKQAKPEQTAKMLARMSEAKRKAYLAQQAKAAAASTVEQDAWLKELFLAKDDTEQQSQQKRECSPLRKSGDDYAFLHKSLQEYFSALSIASELIILDEDEWQQTLKDSTRLGRLKITQKLLTDDYAVLRFAAELVDQRVRGYIPTWATLSATEEKASDQGHLQQFQPFGKALFDLIEASRHFSEDQVESNRINVAAANAISILNYANVSLAGRDFSKAQLGALPKTEWQKGTHAFADLNCALLDSANLQEANLDGSRLQEASLRFADLRRCELSNVILGRGRTLQGHTDTVRSLALSSDGKTLFSGSYDNSIRQWNVDAGHGELKQTLQGHTDAVMSLALSSDGKTLFSAGGNPYNSGSYDNSIRQWNVETGELKQTLQGHTGDVYCLALSSDGKTLFSGSSDKSIRQWNVETGELKQTLQGHTSYVMSLALSSDGKTLFSGSWDNSIRQWNVETGELKQTLQGHTGDVYCLALSSDGKTLFSGSSDNSIRQWNVDAGHGELKQTLQGHTGTVWSLALSSDGKTLFSGAGRDDNSIREWNVETGELKQTLHGHTDTVMSLALSSDGKTLFSGSYDKSIRQWNLDSDGVWILTETSLSSQSNVGCPIIPVCVWTATGTPSLYAKGCLLNDHLSPAASILVEFGALLEPQH